MEASAIDVDSFRRGRARLWVCAMVLLGAGCEVPPPVPGTAPTLSSCDFQHAGSAFRGTCGRMDDETPVFTLAPAAEVTSGVWRTDMHPTAVWSGTMTFDDSDDPAELEVYDRDRGVLRTELGWFAASEVVSSPRLSFKLDASREIKPGTLDRTIVERAAAILSSRAVWNRADERTCPATATTWSIYCAMQKATVELTGGANHRRPAMEAVRQIIDERSAGRGYHHRLMDYNNDPRTTLDDVQRAFRDALAGMGDPRWLATHGFATALPF